jgi:ATP-dependent RNA helicase RhlE
MPYLKDIEKLIKKKIPVVEDHPYPLTIPEPAAAISKSAAEEPKKPARRRHRSRKSAQ